MDNTCPVPMEQRPLQQYEELRQSWFFRWADPDVFTCLKPFALCWLLLTPVTTTIASGSVPLQKDPPRLLAAGLVGALVLPLLLLVRQWLGWTFVLRRLLAESIEYEESGWYDGQIWEKPLAWRQKDWLVAHHQVRPLLLGLQQLMTMASVVLLLGAALCRLV